LAIWGLPPDRSFGFAVRLAAGFFAAFGDFVDTLLAIVITP
jgi:hypothetical protein